MRTNGGIKGQRKLQSALQVLIFMGQINPNTMNNKVLLIIIAICITHHLFADYSLRKSKDFALFFAVKDYEDDGWSDLRNPISDAEAVAKELKEVYDFTTEIIRNPTKAQIYKKIRAYQAKTFVDDAQLFVFFSGHGAFIDANSEGFFVPKDGRVNDEFQDSYIPYPRLKNMINNIKCNHILMAIDACFSGTVDERLANENDQKEPPNRRRPGEGQDSFIRNMLKHQSRFYLTSGGKERTPDGILYSPFTEHFLQGLRDYPHQDGVLTFWELLGYMKNADPLPRHGKFGKYEPGGNFVFVDKANPESSKTTTLIEPGTSQGSDAMAWEIAKTIDTEKSYDYYLQYYPKGKFVEAAIKAISKKIVPKDPSGKIYNFVVLNRKIWLAENMNYNTGEGSWCYENKIENCQKYGRLYNWEGAKKACAALGNGWRLPTDEEWKTLAEFSGGYYDYASAEYIKDDKVGYQTLTIKGKDKFAALLGGYGLSDDYYINLGRSGPYWSATEVNKDDAWHFVFKGEDLSLVRVYDGRKSEAMSCRCIRN